jgi:hypothetical protein
MIPEDDETRGKLILLSVGVNRAVIRHPQGEGPRGVSPRKDIRSPVDRNRVG